MVRDRALSDHEFIRDRSIAHAVGNERKNLSLTAAERGCLRGDVSPVRSHGGRSSQRRAVVEEGVDLGGDGVGWVQRGGSERSGKLH